MKKTTLFLILTLLVHVSTVSGHASLQDGSGAFGTASDTHQEEPSVPEQKKERDNNDTPIQGHYFGLTSGFDLDFNIFYGLTYRYMPGNIGFQITAMPTLSLSDYYSTEKIVYSALSLLIRLHETEMSMFYLDASVSGSYSYENYQLRAYNFIAGFGFEYRSTENLAYDLTLGIGAFNKQTLRGTYDAYTDTYTDSNGYKFKMNLTMDYTVFYRF